MSVSALKRVPSNGVYERDAEHVEEPIALLDSLAKMREWRERAFLEKKTVGFVPTMGALHAGHLSLVGRSLLQNDLTVVSIFVNPAQFAPHEDLATYPRTLTQDLKALGALSAQSSSSSTPRRPAAVFVPSVKDMYPDGIVQNVADQKGTFVEVKGYDQQMEGRSRPTFFRGVATVVTKLFNAVQPTHAYFGQKDIQQALLLRRMVRDLLLSHPLPENLHIIPTYRDQGDGLALSSRNAYLSANERLVASVLYRSLKKAEQVWRISRRRDESVKAASELIQETCTQCEARGQGVVVKLDYIEINDPTTFEAIQDSQDGKAALVHRNVIISGAVWVGKTRLIDNLIVSFDDEPSQSTENEIVES